MPTPGFYLFHPEDFVGVLDLELKFTKGYENLVFYPKPIEQNNLNFINLESSLYKELSLNGISSHITYIVPVKENHQITPKKIRFNLDENKLIIEDTDTYLNTISFEGNNYKIFVEKDRIMVFSPFQRGNLEAFLNQIKQQYPAKHIIFGVVGQGGSEQHIIPHFYNHNNNNQLLAFDSKFTNLSVFYDSLGKIKDDRSFLTKASDFFKLLINSLAFRPKQTYKLGNYTINSVHLGTQSLLDGVKCGPSAINIFKNLWKTLKNNKIPELNMELENLVNYDIALQIKSPIKSSVYGLGFRVFIQTAWQKTFLLDDKNESRRFSEYFVKWPKEPNVGIKVGYVLSLKFFIRLLLSIAKSLIIFPYHAVTEGVSYLRNQLLSLEPKQRLGQYLRTFGIAVIGFVEICLKLLRPLVLLITQSIFSPIEHFKVSWKQNRVLGALSLLVSLAAFGAALYFAAPVVLGLLSTALPVVLTAMALLPIPTLLLGSVLLTLFILSKVIEWGVEKLWNWASSKEDLNEEQEQPVANPLYENPSIDRVGDESSCNNDQDDDEEEDLVVGTSSPIKIHQ